MSPALRRFSRHRLAVAGLVCLVLIVTASVAAPLLTPYTPTQQSFTRRLQGPSAQHLLGTDQFGRDIYTRILYGGRLSVLFGVAAVAIGLAAGGSLGLAAGYFRRVDGPAMRAMDVLLSFPAVLLAIIVVAILGPGFGTVMLAVGIRQIPAYARMVRGAVLVVKALPYTEAAMALGSTHWRTIRSTIVPNCVAPVLVFSTLQIANAILLASILSFLGLGVQPPAAEWGIMVNQGRAFLRDAPHVAIVPGLAIFLVVMSFNMIGDGLRDSLDVRLRDGSHS
ncbi:MAG TPA: ABC transporter permease [Thermodesulfobacteriota bacterium]